MTTIVICDGLTDEVMGSQQQYLEGPASIGLAEIERLMGEGTANGKGILPFFLAKLDESNSSKNRNAIVFLENSRSEDTEIISDNRGTILELFARVVENSVVIKTQTQIIPGDELLATIQSVSGTGKNAAVDSPRILLIGAHTEKRILNLATFLHNVAGYSEVSVSQHLAGSSSVEGHYSALRHHLPQAGISVLTDMAETAKFVGLNPADFQSIGMQGCEIGPKEITGQFQDDEKEIVRLLCTHWTRADLKPLTGGFSGSHLFIARGWIGTAETEPMVLKIDHFNQMRKEIEGYQSVKNYFGKHVPTFGYPVTKGDFTGVGMELAAMEGSPITLQELFEKAETDEDLDLFMTILDKSLTLISSKLYNNTKLKISVAPYRAFGLHIHNQISWLKLNLECINQYLVDDKLEHQNIDTSQLEALFPIIVSNEDAFDMEVCISHGDLNYANIISDEGGNVWFIDWTFSKRVPREYDFAKLENDIKFVLSQDFNSDDFGHLKIFEEYLLENKIPALPTNLPKQLQFAKWDLRYRKILTAVRKIRGTCFNLQTDDDWLVYKIALLKFSIHSLSFDKRRGRGNCELPQLLYALFSSEILTMNLLADDFHLKIRAERPPSYPERLRISIDSAPWSFDAAGYEPPYHVDSIVLENDSSKNDAGWADPEEYSPAKEQPTNSPKGHHDSEGKMLNPRGRTGIAGRGLLGRWGPNPKVILAVIRPVTLGDTFEILLVNDDDNKVFEIPNAFVHLDESPNEAVNLMTQTHLGIDIRASEIESISKGYIYSPKQTDHAWVESNNCLIFENDGEWPSIPLSSDQDGHTKWWTLEANTINNLASNEADIVRKSITKLSETQRMDKTIAKVLLGRTG